MLDVRFPVDAVRGVPVVTAPAELDATNAHRFRVALVNAAAGGAVLLAVPCAAVQRVLAITGIGQVVPHCDSLDEALARATESADS